MSVGVGNGLRKGNLKDNIPMKRNLKNKGPVIQRAETLQVVLKLV